MLIEQIINEFKTDVITIYGQDVKVWQVASYRNLLKLAQNGWYFVINNKKYTPQEIKKSMIKYYSFRKNDYSAWSEMIRSWGLHPRML